MGKNIKWFLAKITESKVYKFIGNYYCDFFAVLSIFVSTISIVLITFAFNQHFSSFMFYLSIVIPYVWLFTYICYNFVEFDFWNNEKNSNNISLFLLIISILFYFLCVVLSCGEIKPSFDVLKKSIITISCIIEVFLVAQVKLNEKIQCGFLLSSIGITAILAISFLFNGKARYGTTDSLVLNFENPNALGLVLATLVVINAMGFLRFKKIYIKILFVLFAIIAFIFLIMCKSRNSLISVIACFALLLFAFYKKNKTHRNIAPWVVSFVPLIVCVVYTVLFNIDAVSDFLNSIFSFALSGKSISTRSTEWTQGFRLFGASPIIGNYYLSVMKSVYLSGYLNAYLDWLVEGGIISAFLFTYIIYQSMKKYWLSSISFKTIDSSFAFSFFPIVLFSSIFESGFFFGLHGLYIYAMLIGTFYRTDVNSTENVLNVPFYEVVI